MFGFKKDEVGKDLNFKGSVFEKLGLSKYTCPECTAHLKESSGDLICLNACHLSKHWQKRISKEMRQIVEKQKSKGGRK